MFRKPETDSWIVASPVGQTSLEWPRTDSVGEIGLTPLASLWPTTHPTERAVQDC